MAANRLGAIAAILALAAGASWLWIGGERPAPVASEDGPAIPSPDATESSPSGGASVPLSVARPSLKEQVDGRVSWPLPAGLQLPGVTHATLAGTLEEWIASLPPDQRARARAFATRYGNGYAFDSPEQQAWMLQHGYPSLEEVVAFDFESMTAQCDRIFCANPKVSALAADEALNRFEESLLEWHDVAVMPSDPMAGLDEGQRMALFTHLVDATSYTRRAREGGSLFFAAQLTAREARLRGNLSEAEATEGFLSACGDKRIQASDAARMSAIHVLSNLPGSPCGISPNRPDFPGY